jgi:RNA-directed DNA polymerase
MRMTTEPTRDRRGEEKKPRRRYTSLMGLLFKEEGLKESYHRQPSGKAVGVDGVSKEDYGRNLAGNLADLSRRLRRLAYRPKASKRVYLEKPNGGKRPIGIPSFEQRIVEDRLKQILQMIWEPEFRECNDGFRANRGAHDALARVEELIMRERTQWVVEADIKQFFDRVHHQHLMRFIEHRIGDRNLLRIIQRLLKAGVLEDGAFRVSESGTPQGGLVSPILANIYLHYVLDVWFEVRFARGCRGKAHLVRYADDFVACFEEEADARRFEGELKERLEKFALEVEPTKTALIRFGTSAPARCQQEGDRRPRTLNFLGFTHYLTMRGERAKLGRKTQRERVNKKLKALGARLQALRILGTRAMQEFVRAHVQGHIGYYGVTGNSRRVATYVYRAKRLLYLWINRRSQQRSFNWLHFGRWIGQWFPRPRIVHDLRFRRMTPAGSRMG